MEIEIFSFPFICIYLFTYVFIYLYLCTFKRGRVGGERKRRRRDKEKGNRPILFNLWRVRVPLLSIPKPSPPLCTSSAAVPSYGHLRCNHIALVFAGADGANCREVGIGLSADFVSLAGISATLFGLYVVFFFLIN